MTRKQITKKKRRIVKIKEYEPRLYNPDELVVMLENYIQYCWDKGEVPSITHFVSIYAHMNPHLAIPVRTYLYDLAVNHQQLSDMLTKVEQIRVATLETKAMNKEFDPGFVKFILSAKYGYREQTENLNKNINITPDDIINKLNDIDDVFDNNEKK